MNKLSDKKQKTINDFVDKAIVSYRNKDFPSGISFLLKAWGELPSPKVIFPDSFRISTYIIEIYLKMNNIDDAIKWSKITYLCDLERAEIGEREFISGKIAFESSNMEDAKYYFWIAHKKSGGRCFVDTDKKYFNFFKEEIKGKYPF